MQSLPGETLGALGQFLTLKDILALATSNKDFQKKILQPEINHQLADYFGFPYGLTLIELKRYEEMSPGARLNAAIIMDDMRIFDKLIELEGIMFEETTYIAAENNRPDMVNKLILHLNEEDFINIMVRAVRENREDIIQIVSKASIPSYKYNIFMKASSEALGVAVDLGNINMVYKITEFIDIIHPWWIIMAARRNSSEIVKRLIEKANQKSLRILREDIETMLDEEDQEKVMNVISKYL